MKSLSRVVVNGPAAAVANPEVEPERGAEPIKSHDFPAGEGALEPVAERRTRPHPGGLQGSTGATRPGAERHLQHPHGGGGGPQIHFAPAVDGAGRRTSPVLSAVVRSRVTSAVFES